MVTKQGGFIAKGGGLLLEIGLILGVPAGFPMPEATMKSFECATLSGTTFPESNHCPKPPTTVADRLLVL